METGTTLSVQNANNRTSVTYFLTVPYAKSCVITTEAIDFIEQIADKLIEDGRSFTQQDAEYLTKFLVDKGLIKVKRE
jgi:hypothetical protein